MAAKDLQGETPRYPNQDFIDQWYEEWSALASENDDVQLERFIARKACDWQAHQCREQVALWMLSRGFATGHGDTIEDLLAELVGEVREQDALICEELSCERNGWATQALRNGFELAAKECASAIRNGGRP